LRGTWLVIVLMPFHTAPSHCYTLSSWLLTIGSAHAT